MGVAGGEGQDPAPRRAGSGGGGETRAGGPGHRTSWSGPAQPGPAPAPRPGRPARPPHFLQPPALTSFSSPEPLPPPPAPPQRGGHQVRPGAGRRAGGPGEGRPDGGNCARTRAGQVCLREAAGGSFWALFKLGGRGRPGGAGSRPLLAGGDSGRVGFFTEGGCPGSREPRGTAEVGGSPAPREKSLKWKSWDMGLG